MIIHSPTVCTKTAPFSSTTIESIFSVQLLVQLDFSIETYRFLWEIRAFILLNSLCSLSIIYRFQERYERCILQQKKIAIYNLLSFGRINFSSTFALLQQFIFATHFYGFETMRIIFSTELI